MEIYMFRYVWVKNTLLFVHVLGPKWDNEGPINKGTSQWILFLSLYLVAVNTVNPNSSSPVVQSEFGHIKEFCD